MAMVDTEMLRRRVAALIDAGRSLDLDSPSAIDILEVFESWDDINRLGWETWYAVAEGLTLSDLTLVIQMLTVLEREFRWSGGSVSSVIWLLQCLKRREPRIAELLMDWVVRRTNNDYLPDGSISSCRDWIRYRSPQVGLRAARDESARDYAMNSERWERERAADLERKRHAEALASEADKAKAAYIARAQPAAQGTPAELLTYVALDTKHGIEFFPKAWARVSRDDLLQLDQGTRLALSRRLAMTNSVTWHRLYKKLIELDSA